MKKRNALLTFAFLLASFALFGQVVTAPSPLPIPQFFSVSGAPLAGGKLFTYQAGTTNPLATYTDGTGLIANTNPIVLNSGGFPTNASGNVVGVWLGPQKYKLILQDSTGVQQWSADLVAGNNFFLGSSLTLAEATAPSGSVGNDLLWADSGSHRLKMNNNNVGADFVIGANTTDTLASKTLTSPILNTPTINSPTLSGPLTVNAAFTACQPNNILHVGGSITCWAGADIGAQINTAYAALPSTGGTIIIDPQSSGTCYSFSTPIVFATSGKFPKLQGSGAAGASNVAMTGSCLNYTPTSASAAISLDYVPTGAQNPPTSSPLRDISLINNQCVTSGGCGSSAVGIQVGNSNAGDNSAIYQNVSVYGFGVGYSLSNNTAFAQTWNNPMFASNTTAFKISSVQSHFSNGFIIGNGQAVVAVAATSPELYFANTFFVENTIGGPAFDFTAANAPSSLNLTNCHLENDPARNAHHISGTVNVIFNGGIMEDDNSVGTGDWMVQLSGISYIQANGLQFLSPRAYTNVFLFNTNSRGFLKAFNLSPGALTSAMLVGGAYASRVTTMIQPTGNTAAPYTWTLESPLSLLENSAPSGAAGAEICYADGAHTIKCSYNNGSFFSVTQTIGTGTSTSNGTLIGAGASQAQPAITVTGATTSDVATCALNAAPVATWQTGIQLLPPVVTANTVTPWLSNPTAGSITPAATVIRCTVTR